MSRLIYELCVVILILLLMMAVVQQRIWNAQHVGKDIWRLNKFHIYLRQFNKHYCDAEEFNARLLNFNASLQEISRLNTLHGSEVFGLTQFSDMSEEEFRRTMLQEPLKECHRIVKRRCPYPYFNANQTAKYESIPKKFDWRKRGVVGEVVNQKQCNGCWAFSIVGVMESMAAIQGKGLTDLSIQELLDCSAYNNGCKGGNMVNALDFLCIEDFPIVTMQEYPLKLVQQKCMLPSRYKPAGWRLKEFSSECDMNENEILWLIANHGPVTAIVNAAPWRNYIDGIIRNACEGVSWRQLNHVIQIVGYDLSGDIPYYIIRNSWGKDFGDHGYVKLEVFRNECGVASNIAYFDVRYVD